MRNERLLLVIDDSATIRKLVELSFRATGWLVEFAVTGQEGLTNAARLTPDVILLDYVLPDLRGSDVCRKLSEDARLAHIPVLIMSAKHDNVRELFQGFAAVAGFVGKPFAATEIVERVQRVIEQCPPREAAQNKPPAQSFARAELAAQAIFTKLRPQLARIPEWMSELGSSAPAAFFARKLLTPQLVTDLLTALAPVLDSAPVPSAPPANDNDTLHGELGPLPLLNLLELLSNAGHTGTLSVRYADHELSLYLRDGAPVFVTSDTPAVYLRGAELGAAPAEAMARAEAQQRSSGKPVLISLTEAGVLDAVQLGPLLDRQGRQLLVHSLARPGGHFCFVKDAAAPAFVSAFARTLSLPDLALEHLRRGPPSEQQPASDPDAVFDRCDQFSVRVRHFTLEDEERRILGAVDGHRSVAEVAEAAELAVERALRIILRLLAVKLIRAGTQLRRAERRGPVLVADRDERHFIAPLRKLLAEVESPCEVVALARSESLVDAIRRESPELVIVNATTAPADALRAAEAVRGYPELDALRLVALLDNPAPDLAGRLTSLGYEAVFIKPVMCADLERLLSGEAL